MQQLDSCGCGVRQHRNVVAASRRDSEAQIGPDPRASGENGVTQSRR
jgi:hypothetical protein